ncbi:MAG TPA: hypothetical protein VL944_01885 [Candidatus Acidoferrum sp.]|nr:hypothetical protein [Candidatus Acidoferrum sp.]
MRRADHPQLEGIGNVEVYAPPALRGGRPASAHNSILDERWALPFGRQSLTEPAIGRWGPPANLLRADAAAEKAEPQKPIELAKLTDESAKEAHRVAMEEHLTVQQVWLKFHFDCSVCSLSYRWDKLKLRTYYKRHGVAREQEV